MCRNTAAGGRRCASSHPAVRVARRAVSPALASSVDGAGADHPAAAAHAQAQAWVAKAKEAAAAGDDERAALYAAHAKSCARASEELLADPTARPAYPNAADPRHAFALDPPAPATMPAEPPAHVRAASVIANASGLGRRATYMPRQDGGQSVMWGQTGFAGSATVYPHDGDGHPYARVAFSSLDRDRYEALARSPWPYRVEGGTVVYDRVPADQAEQIVRAAATGRPGRPWEQHGLQAGGHRSAISDEEADRLVPESSAWAAGLSADEQSWVSTYTGGAYRDINEHLYRGKSPDARITGQQATMREAAAHLDRALAKAPASAQPHRTYRGFTPPDEVRQADGVASWARSNFVVGQTYRDDSYVSTSHCPEAAARFSRVSWSKGMQTGRASHRVVFEVVSRRGAAMAAAGSGGNVERERLLPRGSTFRVVGVHENATVAGHKAVLVQLVDVRDIQRP